VQMWTLVATGSGILLAIPPVNTLFHGTYAIVIHAMGSMIGVLFMLVITGALVVVGASASLQRVRTGVALVNGSLASLWLYLVALGAYEGWARVNMDPLIVSQQLRPWLGGFVLLGGVLLVGISLLSLELIQASRRALRQAADEQPIPRPQTEPLGPTTPA